MYTNAQIMCRLVFVLSYTAKLSIICVQCCENCLHECYNAMPNIFRSACRDYVYTVSLLLYSNLKKKKIFDRSACLKVKEIVETAWEPLNIVTVWIPYVQYS